MRIHDVIEYIVPNILIVRTHYRFLTYLNLSHNCIRQILDNSLPCTLVEIDLSYNDLEHIQWDMSLSMCETLYVSHNKLKLLHFLNVSLVIS